MRVSERFSAVNEEMAERASRGVAVTVPSFRVGRGERVRRRWLLAEPERDDGRGRALLCVARSAAARADRLPVVEGDPHDGRVGEVGLDVLDRGDPQVERARADPVADVGAERVGRPAGEHDGARRDVRAVAGGPRHQAGARPDAEGGDGGGRLAGGPHRRDAEGLRGAHAGDGGPRVPLVGGDLRLGEGRRGALGRGREREAVGGQVRHGRRARAAEAGRERGEERDEEGDERDDRDHEREAPAGVAQVAQGEKHGDDLRGPWGEGRGAGGAGRALPSTVPPRSRGAGRGGSSPRSVLRRRGVEPGIDRSDDAGPGPGG